MRSEAVGATTSSFHPPAPMLMTGDEPIAGADVGVRDFWAWCLSDLRTNTVRPMLAEFLVARAVGAEQQTRIEWDAYDVPRTSPSSRDAHPPVERLPRER